MGRPLNKKYFGNRNVGASATTDNGIGGEGVASVTITAAGKYQANTTVTFDAPTLPTGVTAVGSVSEYKAVSATVTAPGGADADNYTAGDILTVTLANGTATFTVATIDGDGGVATVTVLNGGTFTGTLLTGAKATTVTAAGGGASTGVGCTLTLDYGVKTVAISNKGSGYTTAADAVPTFGNGVGGAGDKATGTAVLTTDSGSAGSTTNQENAIVAYAWVNAKTVTTENDTLNNTAASGSSVVGDIIKQTNDRVYKVKTAQGTGRCILVAAAPAEPTVLGALGEMNIIATDYTGNTYYVTKLTSRKAVLTRKTQHGSDAWEFATGTTAKWKFGALVVGDTGYTVQLENA